MRIIRVFPRRTSMTPTDELAFVGEPPEVVPLADEIHISCCFTWDKDRAWQLSESWTNGYSAVRLGGPAFDLPKDDFISGRYLAPGITITSRGCNRRCWFCFVPDTEGKFRELPDFPDGNIVQDNNLLMSSPTHFDRVLEMLSRQRRGANFRGGLDPRLLTDWHVDRLRQVRVKALWLSADDPSYEPATLQAIYKLRGAGFPRDKIRCYVMVDWRSETMQQADARIERLFRWGSLPFVQLYRDDSDTPPPVEWRRWARQYCRPPILKAMLKERP